MVIRGVSVNEFDGNGSPWHNNACRSARNFASDGSSPREQNAKTAILKPEIVP